MTEPDWITTTRASYDVVAEDYAVLLADALDDDPLDRALLTVFLEKALDVGPVLDLGCGPGRLTGFLRVTRPDVVGIDLSPGMVATARRLHPGAAFEVGSLTSLDRPDASAGGILAWYSLIHVPTPELPAVLAGIARVLAPGAPFLTAFQVGEEPRHLDQGYGHDVDLTNHRRTPELVAALLEAAGLPVRTRVVSEPEGPQLTQQAFLLSRRSRAR